MVMTDNCAYIYKKAGGIRCGYTRQAHHTAGLGHNFVSPEPPKGTVAFVDGTLRDAKDTNQLATQPAPDAGEWHTRQTLPGEARAIFDGEGRLVANAISGDLAAQIIADHNLVPRLETALKELLVEAEVSNVLWQQSRGFTGTVQDAYAKGLMPPAYVRAREILEDDAPRTRQD